MSEIVEQHIPCPVCPSSDAYCLYRDGHGYCYSCQYYKPKKDYVSDQLYTYEYLPWRGITKRTMEFFDVRTKINAEGKPISVGFQYPTGAYKVRTIEKKEFRWEPPGDTSKAGLYGRDKFTAGGHKYVTITEGELDALSIWQCVGIPVVSTHSATSGLRDVTVDRSWLNTYDKIFLGFDNDPAGKELTKSVARLFDYNKVYVLDYDRHKDANDYLQAGQEDDLRNLWWNAKRYLPETILNVDRATARQILSENPKYGVSYPFPVLTGMTYGIRRGESVLLTAQEGVGKTELMHAIEHHILRETDDAVGAIYLEEPKRRHLQALAGIELQRPAHLPDSGCSEAEIMAAVEKSIKNDERLYLYSHFGSDDPDILLDTIRFMVTARNVVFVFLDHISMVVSGLAGEDERKALDYIATRLEMMVKELSFSLIMVSHVNDQGQTRGSRYISKIADIRIDAVRDILNPDFGIRNTTFLSVAKNRYCGRTGAADTLIFDPLRYRYISKEAANDNELLSSNGGYAPSSQAA